MGEATKNISGERVIEMNCLKCGKKIRATAYLVEVGYCPDCEHFQKMEIITECEARKLFPDNFIDWLKPELSKT